MASHSLYRKWRSQSFLDIIGQEHVVATLRNAVKTDRVAHAYLFTGPRGTGKTSVARILAKAVNCLAPQEGGPCNTCELCRSIAEGRAPDVIEIDGASNNSIDDVRALRERVGFAPAEGRYKVYIIDEVHRLSGSAFDGLLKTLEEPPPHVVFVFASTEPHKLPATILSRCQRFDFHKITREQAIGRLRDVAAGEGIAVDEDALVLVAQQSGGSLRDALGLLDQVSALGLNYVTVDAVRQTLGLSRASTVGELTALMLSRRLGDSLALINRAVADGSEPRQLAQQLVDYWRNLLLATAGAIDEVDVDPSLTESIMTHSQSVTAGQVVTVLHALTEAPPSARLNVAPQLPFEMAVTRAVLALTEPAATDTSVRPLPQPVREAHEPGQPAAPSPLSTPAAVRPPATEAIPALSPPASATAETASPVAVQPAHDGPASDGNGAILVDNLSPGSSDEAASAEYAAVLAVWPSVLEAMREKNRKLQALLKDAHPMQVNQSEMTLGFPYSFHRETIAQPENRAVVESILAELLGSRVAVRCVQASRDEIRSLQGSSDFEDDDRFIEEAERLLRAVHARRLDQ